MPIKTLSVLLREEGVDPDSEKGRTIMKSAASITGIDRQTLRIMINGSPGEKDGGAKKSSSRNTPQPIKELPEGIIGHREALIYLGGRTKIDANMVLANAEVYHMDGMDGYYEPKALDAALKIFI